MRRSGRRSEPSVVSRRPDRLAVGLFIPVSGAAGIWGPSCRACAELASVELNAGGGLDGREVVLNIVDAGGDPDSVADTAQFLIEERAIDAVVGMHTSDVRTAVAERISGKVPYVYTPLYEGGEAGRGVFCIGETPARQLLPALDWLCGRYNLRRWFLVGNDYVWPHKTHGLMKRHSAGRRPEIVGEAYVPFGTQQFDQVIARIRDTRADAVLLSIVGDDCVHFNRAFSRSGMSRSVLRFSCAVEENMLLAIGADNLDGLFVASGYFGALDTNANGAFRERYYACFGERGPTLNTIGQSVYEGMHFLNALAEATCGKDWLHPSRPIKVDGVRSALFDPRGLNQTPVYMAEANGYNFRIIQSFF